MATVFETRDVTSDEEVREKIRVEIMKIIAETSKINTETRWHPLMVTTASFATGVAFIKVLDMLVK
ncbi:MAG: hypothetical protein WBW32_16935 [Luteibacter sp.]